MKTVLELANARHVLNALSSQKMKASLAFIIANNLKKLSEELEAYEKTQSTLFERYSEQSEEGTIIPEENQESFNAEMEELLSVKIDEPKLTKISLEKLDSLEITPGEISLISFLIEE